MPLPQHETETQAGYPQLDAVLKQFSVNSQAGNINLSLTNILLNLKSRRMDINSIIRMVNAVKETHWKLAMSLRGVVADNMISIFQEVLDILEDSIEESSRRVWVIALKGMRTLSSQPGVNVPSCLLLETSTLPSSEYIEKDPSIHGGQADIRKCNHPDLGMLAVKTPRMPTTNDKAKLWMRECIQWRQARHPNILPFLGFYMVAGLYGAVSRWISPGNLTDYVKDGEPNRVELAAKGLQYLHKLQFVHGDLKGQNALVTEQGRVLLCDFGGSFVNHTIESLSISDSPPCFTLAWTPPELIRGTISRPTKESDMWSMGCLILEIISGMRPYCNIAAGPAVVVAINEGKAPMQDSYLLHCSPYSRIPLRALISRCCRVKATGRPSISEVVQALQKLSSINDRSPNRTVEEDYMIEQRYEGRIQDRFGKDFELLRDMYRVTSVVESRDPNCIKYKFHGSATNVPAAINCVEGFKKNLLHDGVKIIPIPRTLFNKLIGRQGSSIKRIERNHGVSVQFLPKLYTSEMSIEGRAEIKGGEQGREKAAEEITQVAQFLNVARSRTASTKKSSPIQPEQHFTSPTVNIRGKSQPVVGNVRTTNTRRTASLPPLPEQPTKEEPGSAAAPFLKEASVDAKVIERNLGGQDWGPLQPLLFLSDIDWKKKIKWCGGPEILNELDSVLFRNRKSTSIRIRGQASWVDDLVSTLRSETSSFVIIGVRVSQWRHPGLRAKVKDIKTRTDALVYFPGRPEYLHCGEVSNKEDVEKYDAGEVIKLIGRREACSAASTLIKEELVPWQDKRTAYERLPTAHYRWLAASDFFKRIKSDFNAILRSENPIGSAESPYLQWEDRTVAPGQPWKTVKRRERFKRDENGTRADSSFTILVIEVEHPDQLADLQELIDASTRKADLATWEFRLSPRDCVRFKAIMSPAQVSAIAERIECAIQVNDHSREYLVEILGSRPQIYRAMEAMSKIMID